MNKDYHTKKEHMSSFCQLDAKRIESFPIHNNNNDKRDGGESLSFLKFQCSSCFSIDHIEYHKKNNRSESSMVVENVRIVSQSR